MNPKPKIRPVPPPDGYLRMVRRRVPTRRYACVICSHEVARNAIHEFARAKEVFKTTHISYKAFLEEYVEATVGFPVSYQNMMVHINNHVRPTLRREIREWEIENARPEKPWEPPKLEDFLVSPIDWNGRNPSGPKPTGELPDDTGVEPVEDFDHDEHPEAKDFDVKDLDPDDDLGRTYARFWKSQGDDDAQDEDSR